MLRLHAWDVHGPPPPRHVAGHLDHSSVVSRCFLKGRYRALRRLRAVLIEFELPYAGVLTRSIRSFFGLSGPSSIVGFHTF